LYAAILLDATAAPMQKEAPPPRPQEFIIGDTVGFTDNHMNERVGTVVRLNSKTASIAVTDSEDTDASRTVFYGKSSISD
jgi:hypothetical protein